MANTQYNVAQLFQVAFGLNSPVFITEPILKNTPANISFKGVEMLPDYYEPEAKSWMGTPIIFPSSFNGRSYKRYDTTGRIEYVAMDDMFFPPATMFSFRRSKNITRTTLLGNEGTIKEIYGFDDWVIDVRGLCLDEPNRSAHEQLEALLRWEEIADAIDISGQLFEQRKISRVAIADWADNVQQGSPGVISFQCQLFSDNDIILEL
ncbi:DUF6046 domain-containing protein [Flavobacterium beibuense]|uniref:DUF6046 domain-containing protein n=1 Tax=Flavobacterium beibuense TaxID=657326 RepID=UPI003A8CC37B